MVMARLEAVVLLPSAAAALVTSRTFRSLSRELNFRLVRRVLYASAIGVLDEALNSNFDD